MPSFFKYILFSLVMIGFAPQLLPLEIVMGEKMAWFDSELEEDAEEEETEEKEKDSLKYLCLARLPGKATHGLIYGKFPLLPHHALPHLSPVFRPPIA